MGCLNQEWSDKMLSINVLLLEKARLESWQVLARIDYTVSSLSGATWHVAADRSCR